MYYKGFDKDLKCRGYQYEVGKEYDEQTADLCKSGFHACESPLDCFAYYPPADSRYCEVILGGMSDKKSYDSKVCGKHIRIGAEIGINGIINAGVKFVFDRVDFKNAKESNTGDQSAATNTGDQSAATNTGDRSAATNTGDRSAATNTGDRSAATNTGYLLRDRVRSNVYRIDATWIVSKSDYITIVDALAPAQFTVQFFDPNCASMQAVSMYVSDRDADLKYLDENRPDNSIWELSCALIEY